MIAKFGKAPDRFVLIQFSVLQPRAELQKIALAFAAERQIFRRTFFILCLMWCMPLAAMWNLVAGYYENKLKLCCSDYEFKLT